MFADNIRFRLGFFRRFGDPGNVLHIIARPTRLPQHMHHIQPPAVHIPRRFQPVADNTVFPAINFIHQTFRLIIQLRQAGIAKPVERRAIITKRVPVAPGRFGVVTSTTRATIMPVKPSMGIATVVKHAVQHQPHSQLLRIVSQTQQRPITAKLRIDMAIILGIVFMYAGSFKHRIEIQRRHAKFFQIRQFFAYPVQIAAIER